MGAEHIGSVKGYLLADPVNGSLRVQVGPGNGGAPVIGIDGSISGYIKAEPSTAFFVSIVVI
jgi:hypothetical protein